MNPRLCGCSFIRPGLSAGQGLSLAHRLGFTTVDLGIGGANGHFPPIAVAQNPDQFANLINQEIGSLALALNECFVLNFGWPINTPRPELRRRTLELFPGVCRFARESKCRSVLLIPGPVHAELGMPGSLDLSAEVLAQLIPIAADHQLLINVEPDIDSCARTPPDAKSLCRQAAGVGLTLDYSHFIAQGIAADQLDPLLPFARHLHIRQAAPGRIAADWERGAIDFATVLQKLHAGGYAGLFCIEYLALSNTEEAGQQAERRTLAAMGAFESLLSGDQT